MCLFCPLLSKKHLPRPQNGEPPASLSGPPFPSAPTKTQSPFCTSPLAPPKVQLSPDPPLTCYLCKFSLSTINFASLIRHPVLLVILCVSCLSHFCRRLRYTPCSSRGSGQGSYSEHCLLSDFLLSRVLHIVSVKFIHLA